MELKSLEPLIRFQFPKDDVGLRASTTSLSTPKAPSSEAEQRSGSYHGCKLESIAHRRRSDEISVEAEKSSLGTSYPLA